MVTIKKTKISDPKKAARRLAQLSVLPDWQDQIVTALHSMGIILVILEHLPGTFLDGAAMCRGDGVPVIALTLRHDRLDNFWFTLLHEFAHVVCHLSPDRQLILDDLDVASSETIEAEADSFARNALIPPPIWKQIDEDSSTEEVMDAAEKAGVHPAIAAGRWRFEHSDYRRFSKLIGRGRGQVCAQISLGATGSTSLLGILTHSSPRTAAPRIVRKCAKINPRRQFPLILRLKRKLPIVARDRSYRTEARRSRGRCARPASRLPARAASRI
jgi:hypothetical protein